MLRIRLDNFDTPPDPGEAPDPTATPSDDWHEGHAAGMRAAAAAAEAAQERIRSELVQMLADISFGYAEAHTHLVATLRPLFAALIDKVLPAMLHETFGAHLLDALMSAAAQDMSRPVRIALHPAHIATFAPFVAQNSTIPVELAGDATLSLADIRLLDGCAETAIDPDGLMADLRAILSAFFTQPQGSQHHG